MFLDKGVWFVVKNDMNVKCLVILGIFDSVYSVFIFCLLKYEIIIFLDLIYCIYK